MRDEAKPGSTNRTDKYSGLWAALWWALALAYPAVLVVASVRPEFGADVTRALVERLLPTLGSRQVHVIVLSVRKAGHLLGYFLFAMILTNAFLCFTRPPRSRMSRVIACTAAGLVAVAVAGMDEYIQLGTAFRSGTRQDVLIDSMGVVASIGWRLRRGK